MAEQGNGLPARPDQLPTRPAGIEKQIYAIAASMTVLAVLAIVLRFYARQLKKTSLSWDDYMILPAMVCALDLGEMMLQLTSL